MSRFRPSGYAVIRLIRAVGIGYLFSWVLLLLFERSLLYPIPNAASGDWNPKGVQFEDVWLNATDGTQLHGWYLPCDQPRAAVVFFHGNGEDVSSCGPEMSRWRDALKVSILVMDFRGYGKSEGKPGEAALVDDGVLSANWLADRQGVDPDQIILWGRSIGGGVAAGVAKTTNPRAMIMECTFDSLANVAAEHVPWAPVRWLMTNQYRSAMRLADYNGRFLQWHGDADAIVSLVSAKRLFDAVGSDNKRFILGDGYGHNDESPSEFKLAVRNLFDTL
jgi:fermentation-respiration switch protein FrsA (DUF1100 family)